VGSELTRPLRARVVAATNLDLHAEARRGAFRGELLFRLDVARIVLPPLRERREDLPALVPVLLGRIAARLGVATPPLDGALAAKLAAHDWPGNVRELENALERWLVGCEPEPYVGATAPHTKNSPVLRTCPAKPSSASLASSSAGS
jgi:two-component system C4-dicarboxylate transport response regulator DctD